MNHSWLSKNRYALPLYCLILPEIACCMTLMTYGIGHRLALQPSLQQLLSVAWQRMVWKSTEVQKFTWTVGVKFKDANDALPSAHTAEPIQRIQRIHLGFLWLSYFYHLLPCPRSKLTTYWDEPSALPHDITPCCRRTQLDCESVAQLGGVLIRRVNYTGIGIDRQIESLWKSSILPFSPCYIERLRKKFPMQQNECWWYESKTINYSVEIQTSTVSEIWTSRCQTHWT